IDQIIHRTNKEKDASRKLFTLIEMHFHQLAADHHLAIVTQLELRQSNSSLRLQINKVLKPSLTVIDRIVEEGKQENVFSQDLNTHLDRQMVFGTLDETVTKSTSTEQKFEFEKLAKEVPLVEDSHNKI